MKSVKTLLSKTTNFRFSDLKVTTGSRESTLKSLKINIIYKLSRLLMPLDIKIGCHDKQKGG